VKSLYTDLDERYKNVKVSYSKYLQSLEEKNSNAKGELISKIDALQANVLRLQSEVDRLNSDNRNQAQKKDKYKNLNRGLQLKLDELNTCGDCSRELSVHLLKLSLEETY